MLDPVYIIADSQLSDFSSNTSFGTDLIDLTPRLGSRMLNVRRGRIPLRYISRYANFIDGRHGFL
jgi:hypothetical protein